MKIEHRLPSVIRYPAAFALAVLTERLLLVIAEDIGFLSVIRDEMTRLPLSVTVTFSLERILLCAVLVFPALFAVDWLVKSRAQSIVISFLAVIVVAWVWTP